MVKSRDYTIVSRSAMENSKWGSWIPKQTKWLSNIKQVTIWEMLQAHTEGRVNRHCWDLLLFVKIYNLKKRTDLYYSPRIEWEKTWFNSEQRSAGWQVIQRSLIVLLLVYRAFTGPCSNLISETNSWSWFTQIKTKTSVFVHLQA